MREDFIGLNYPARHQLVASQGATLTVYVPVPAARHQLPSLAPGSGIVGEPLEGDPTRLLCHFEGWVHGAMQYADRDDYGRWEAAVEHAAGRAFVLYPTIARAAYPREALHEVGTIDAATMTVTVTDELAVRRWLAVGPPGR